MSLSQKEADIQMMLAAKVHLGTKNCDHQMERYIYKRGSDGEARHPYMNNVMISCGVCGVLARTVVRCHRGFRFIANVLVYFEVLH